MMMYQNFTLSIKYGLKSQLAESVPKTVLARYHTKQWHHCYKDVHWIWHPIHFRRPQVDLLAGRDWSLTLYSRIF
ncbi:MAG: Hypothetical protein AJITA_00755 [Acetilactobacillus jinshanensis]